MTQPVDIALYDTFAQGEADDANLDVLVANPNAAQVAIYTWSFHRGAHRQPRSNGRVGLPVQDA